MHRVYLGLIIGVVWHGALAETNLSLTAGARDELRVGDRFPALGFATDFGRDEWAFRPELGGSLTFDPVGGGDEAELSAGAIAYWDAAALRVHFGVGASSLAADLVNDSATTLGLYLHGGLSWGRSARRVGFDIRYLNAHESRVNGALAGGDYMQFALLFSW